MMLYYAAFIVFPSLKCFVCEIKKLQVSGHLANQMGLAYRITARCMPVVSLIFEHIKCLRLRVCYLEEIMFQLLFVSRCMVFSPSHALRAYSLFPIKKIDGERILHISSVIHMFGHICLTLWSGRKHSKKFS